jgi:helicase MOV-10
MARRDFYGVRQLLDSVYEGQNNAQLFAAMLYEYLTWSPWRWRHKAVFTCKPGYGIAGLAVDLWFLISLTVPGLAEKRPSVITGEYFYYVKLRYVTWLGILGDTILAKISESGDDRWYEGHVHHVHEAQVALRFHRSFERDTATQPLDVRFQVNRVTLRRQHQALYAEHHAAHLLFPPAPVAASPEPSDLTLNDPKIANNYRQFQAIKQILSLPAMSAPYIIFGP